MMLLSSTLKTDSLRVSLRGVLRDCHQYKAERGFKKMKFNFAKIASAAASAAIVGSTVALAAAASWPAPFVEDGTADVAVVWGNSPDLVPAVADITGSLNAAITAQGGSSGSTVGAPTSGDFVKLEKGSNLFNIGDTWDEFFNPVSDEELEEVLADGEYISDSNDDYEYEQTLDLGSHALSFFEDSDFNRDDPMLGFALPNDATVMTYTLEFTDEVECGADFEDCISSELPLMGKNYFISDISTTSNGWRFELLDSAVEQTVTEGETVTVNVDGVAYTVSISFISADEVTLNINGELVDDLGEGDTKQLAGGEAHIGVKSINKLEVAGELGSVQFSLGEGEITLEDGQEVELNGETINDLTDSDTVTVDIVNSSATDLESMTLTWTRNEEAWVAPGTDLTFPVFETFTMSMAGFNTPEQEMLTVEGDGDTSIAVDTYAEEGAVTFHLLYTDDSSSPDWDGLGEDSDHKLVTSAVAGDTTIGVPIALNESEDSYFVATWINGDEAESYVFEISGIAAEGGENHTTLNNLASGGDDVTIDGVGETENIGEVEFLLVAANDAAGTASVNITALSSGNVYADRFVTKEGLQFKLPIASDTITTDGYVNVTGAAPTWVMNFTEEDEDDNVADGSSFTITVGFNADDEAEVTATSVSLEEVGSSDTSEGYVASSLATMVTYDNPSSGPATIDIEYHGGESYADVYLSGYNAMTNGDTGSAGQFAIQDDQLASSGMGMKNLIIVGGTCINSAAQQVLNLNAPACGSAWTSAVGEGGGQGEWIIQTFASPWADDKVATLVAGYDVTDTANAATALRTQSSIDISVGKKYKGTTATTVSPVIG
jgi:hypothetical protein